MANRRGKTGSNDSFYFLGLQKSLWMVTLATKLKDTIFGRKAMTSLCSILKSRDITLPTKVHIVKAMVFPVVMYGCVSWTIKKAEHWKTDAFEFQWWKRFENLLNCKEIKPVGPKGNQPWIFIRTNAEAKAPIQWPPDRRSQLWKTLWCWARLRAGELGNRGWDGWMVRWHHWLNGHEFEQTLEDSEGQGSLTCYSPWGYKEPDMT